LTDWKLVLVGTTDYPDSYAREVLRLADQTPGVICAGFLGGQPLAEMYMHAGLFVLPSSHEGLPITLLEALSYGLPILASDIPANKEVQLPPEHYFPLGNTASLAEKLREFTQHPVTPQARETRREWVRQRYDWHDIARRTLAVYQNIAQKSSSPINL
jgi:glycosyltransferase involved in cell wall biosynthesis